MTGETTVAEENSPLRRARAESDRHPACRPQTRALAEGLEPLGKSRNHHTRDGLSLSRPSKSATVAGTRSVVEAVLEEFDEYLALQRGRSEHTRRAYLGDLRSLIAFVRSVRPMRARGSDAAPAAVVVGGAGHRGAAAQRRWPVARRRCKTFTAWASRSRVDGRRSGHPAAGPQSASHPACRTAPGSGPRRHECSDSGAQQGDPLALRDRLIVEMLYATGIRVSELCGLDLDDVDSSRRLLRVLGKGNKQRTVPFGEPAQRALAVLACGWQAHPGHADVGARVAAGRARQADRSAAGPHRGASDDGRRRRRTRHRPARAAAQCGHASARGRGRPSGGAGTAGPLDIGDDPALHPRDGRPAARGARPGPSPRLAEGRTTSEAAQ